MAWYYSNDQQFTQYKDAVTPLNLSQYCYAKKVGPFENTSQLKALFGSTISVNTFIANQDIVPFWTELNKLPEILKQISPNSRASSDEYFRYCKSNVGWNYNKRSIHFGVIPPKMVYASNVDKNKIQSAVNTVYCVKEINSSAQSKHIWEFKVSGALWIGVDSSTRARLGSKNIDHNVDEKATKHYEYCCSGHKKSWKLSQTVFGDSPTSHVETICMVLDLSNKTLSFGVNGKQPQIAFRNIVTAANLKYSCAISAKSGSATLLEYSHTEQKIDDQKQNNQILQLRQQYQSTISLLQQQNRTLQSTVSSLQRTISTQQSQLQALNNNPTRNENVHADELNRVKRQLAQIKSNMLILQKENEELKLKLQDGSTSSSIASLDYTKWQQWDTNHVYKFIADVENGILSRYNNVLKKRLFEGKYKGTDLITLTMNDIKDLGVLEFQHRKLLRKAIDKITQNKAMSVPHFGNDVEGKIQQTQVHKEQQSISAKKENNEAISIISSRGRCKSFGGKCPCPKYVESKSKWSKGKCSCGHKLIDHATSFSTGVAEKVKAKKKCAQCSKNSFGKLDNDDGNFYCNQCWSEF